VPEVKSLHLTTPAHQARTEEGEEDRLLTRRTKIDRSNEHAISREKKIRVTFLFGDDVQIGSRQTEVGGRNIKTVGQAGGVRWGEREKGVITARKVA